jgi:hypothetical protein
LAKTTPTGPSAGFVITRVSGGYGVARGGEIQSVHATRAEAETMVAALKTRRPPRPVARPRAARPAP